MSPVFLEDTEGVFPTAGAIIAARVLGRVWAKHRKRPGNKRIALGISLICGAQFTDWSVATNLIFFFAGVITIIRGYYQNKKLNR